MTRTITIGLLAMFMASCSGFSLQKVSVSYNSNAVSVTNKNEEPVSGSIIINDTDNGGKAISSFFLVAAKSTVVITRDSLIDNTTGQPIVLHDSLQHVCFYTQPNTDEVGKTACAE